VFSPDGSHLAFTLGPEPAGGALVEVMVADGSDVHDLTTCNYSQCSGSPSWFPDGRRLVIWRTGDIWGVNIDRSDAHVIARRGDAAIGTVLLFPDGRHIAYERSINDATAIWVMNAGGTANRIVGGCACPSNDNESLLGWSPDSRHLLVGEAGGLWLASPDGGDMRRLTSCDEPSQGCAPDQAAFSPDGSRIAYVSREGLSVLNADGSGLRTLVGCSRLSYTDSRVSGGCLATDPTWSPDGTSIAFVYHDAHRWGVRIVDLDGREVAFHQADGAEAIAWQALPAPQRSGS
jgi:Tol biopolymer transport system component